MGIETRLIEKPYQPEARKIVFTTQVRGLASHSPARGRQTPAQIREAEEIMSVVKAQPHRRGSDDPRLASPLGRFCARIWAKDAHLRAACYSAGGDYAREVREALAARGFNVEGLEPETQRGNSGSQDPTAQEIADQQLKIAEKDRIVAAANAVLVPIDPRLPRAMESLCCTLDEPSPYREGMLQAGLWRLAGHYGLLDRGINSLRAY